jgi:hypothetical protein
MKPDHCSIVPDEGVDIFGHSYLYSTLLKTLLQIIDSGLRQCCKDAEPEPEPFTTKSVFCNNGHLQNNFSFDL